ncbi:soluble lytic murein transglycosylase [Peptostreptococcus russellii]|uniref:Soluble lytic murein transglycosylase n=1 Tax=Peptostreptococcus russellii TaxID=215200 RepID=A0A1H8FR18_9FIRM|nr:lytic transglycosylase domain-containing protein [Peptostreptococcus russellii]SEN33995.1 soluble lytic murein transglycosylase [Peptostreptococcus russellii]
MKEILKKIALVSIMLLTVVLCVNYNQIERIFYPTEYSEYVEKYSEEYKVDKYLIYSIIKTESKFNPDAVSSKGAAGLMQITDVTASWAAKELKLKNADIHDPETNIRMGTWYLHRLNKEFKGDLSLMISAYNGGSGNVRKWLRSSKYSDDGKSLTQIPFKETSQYTEKVLKNYRKYREIYVYYK